MEASVEFDSEAQQAEDRRVGMERAKRTVRLVAEIERAGGRRPAFEKA